MRINSKLVGIALSVLIGGAMVSCSNELNDSTLNGQAAAGIKLVKDSKVTAWSGNTDLANPYNTKSTRAEESGFFTIEEVEDDWTFPSLPVQSGQPTTGPQNIRSFLGGTGDQSFWMDPCPAWIKERHSDWIVDTYQSETGAQIQLPAVVQDTKQDGLKNLNLNFTIKGEKGLSFKLYPHKTDNTDQNHEIGIFYFDAQNDIHKIQLWNANTTGTYDKDNGKIKGVSVKLERNCKFGFYFSGRNNKENKYYPTEKEDTVYYSLPSLNDYKHNYYESDWNLETNKPYAHNEHAGLVPYDKLPDDFGTIILLEDWTDFDFDDFMLLIPEISLPTIGEGESVTNEDIDGEDQDPDDDDYCDWSDDCINGKHPKHKKGHCDSCPEGEGCNTPDDSNNNTPDVVLGTAHNEVEVNLSINDKDNQGDIEHLVSKLSIHVRYPNDVKIRIPVPAVYQVAQDDFYIFNEHYGVESVYGGGQDKTITYTIGEGEDAKTVTLTVKHVLNNDEVADGVSYIEVTTSGIDQDIFDYCRANYGDGLNFEVYSYFNYFMEEGRELVATDNSHFAEAAEALKKYLDQATIEFIDKDGNALGEEECPEYYINAFNDTQDNVHGAKDCTVGYYDETQEGYYDEGKTGAHLNQGEDNVIYKKESVENESEHNTHDHEFLWSYTGSKDGESE